MSRATWKTITRRVKSCIFSFPEKKLSRHVNNGVQILRTDTELLANHDEYWATMARVIYCTVLKTLTLFQTKVYNFPELFSDLTPKLCTLFKAVFDRVI